MTRSRLVPYLQATFAVLLWGASFVATKVALRYLAPDALVWLRFGMGLALLGLTMLARRQFELPGRNDLAYFALLGLIGITFHQWLQSNGLVTAQATTGSWIVATSPIFIALLGWLALKEKLSAFQILGIGVAVLGVLLVVSRGDLRALVGGRAATTGDFLMMVSAPNWAVFSILSRRGLKQHPAARMMFYVMAFGWGFTTLLFLLNPQFAAMRQMPWDGWIGVIFLGVFCSGLAYIFWYDALKSIPASQVGVFLYIEPLVTVAVAWAVLGERLTWASLIGGAVTLTGIWMVNRLKPAPRDEKVEGAV
ncbi:permease of the drug/metabolite transporter (DMT) superfamily [Longilinea arvoryzae]|uniref:Permease of the drug/metabolite transporter (DMT) superfamily n=1 Tax=Longilinea arvoryzae TaxID=360412 RepID=A0A0S7BH18_9CHLR|nr:DMT family transporter [Longilinea arvoryzae]GAP13013.1 permease of the drug/metabolite transporter (DMT) superfamily [Longilinea arvoryzae]